MSDINQVIDQLGRGFAEFKATNEQRLAQIEAKGYASADIEAKLNTISANLSQLDELKNRLEAVEVKTARPAAADSTADVEYKNAFNRFIRKGDDSGLQLKAHSIGTDADGGYAVPEELDRNIAALLRDASPMRSVATNVMVGTSDYKKLVSIHGSSTGWVGETAARPATTSASLAQVAPSMGELYAFPQATQQMLDDVFFNAEQWIAQYVSEEFALAENLSFTTGDGDNQPKGFLDYTYVTTADASRTFGQLQYTPTGAAGDFAASSPHEALIDLVYSLKAGYRPNAVWQANALTLAEVRKMVDGNGNLIWQPGLSAGQPSTLLGYPVVENEDMPAIAADALAMAFGDFRRGYYVVDRMGTRVLRDPYSSKPYVGFYVTKRVGGAVVDSQAIKALKFSAT